MPPTPVPTPVPTATATASAPPPTDRPVPTDPTPTYPVLEVPLSARKNLSGGTLKAGEFSFELRDNTGKLLAEVKNQADGSVVFPVRTFTREVNNYLYTITERAGTDSKTTYDKTVYTIKVSTRAVDGRLQAQVDILKNGTPYAGELVFANARAMPPTGDSRLLLIVSLGLVSALLGGSAIYLKRRRKN